MQPPLDVPSAPSRLATDSSAMPRSRIASFNAAALAPDHLRLWASRTGPADLTICMAVTSPMIIVPPGLARVTLLAFRMSNDDDDLPFKLYERLVTDALKARLLRFDSATTRIITEELNAPEAHATLAR